jgi:two-component system OmpR family response regulator
MRVLIVEDDARMAAAIRRGLQTEGVVADVTQRGEDALWMAEATAFDAVVLDVVLPGIDGFDTCRRLREGGVWTPIIMLTARDAIEDHVRGLDHGADDYVVKPFSVAECSRGWSSTPSRRWDGAHARPPCRNGRTHAGRRGRRVTRRP